MGLLEVIGVASILPFMQLIADPTAIEQSSWLTAIYDFFAFDGHREMLIYFGVGIIVFIAITNLFSVFTVWLQYKFSWDLAHQLGLRLLRTFIDKPYSYFLQKNASELQTFIISEVGSLTGGVIIPLIEIFSRVFVSLIIFGLLLMVDAKIALIMAGGLGGGYVLIYLFQAGFLKKIGHYRLEMNMLRFKSLNELLNGIKTLMVYNEKPLFYRRFEYASKEFCDVQPKYNLLLAAPRYALEFLAFGSILAITLYLFFNTGNIQGALPRLSLYAVAGYRLLPALQKAFAAFAKLRHNYPVFDRLYDDLKQSLINVEHNKDHKERLVFKESITIQGLSFQYENTDNAVIKDLSVCIKKGQKIAFIGSTGSGKTTLVDLIVGLLDPVNGHIKIDGLSLDKSNITHWQNNIAYVSQEVFLFDDSILRNIVLGVNEIDEKDLKKATQMAEIYDFITQELPEGFDTEIGDRGLRLSGGQRQRLGLSRALYKQPSVLVLDEATSALDSITEKSIIRSLASLPENLTTIIIAHRLSTVRHADCIYVLKDGKIVDKGNYNELMQSNDTFKTMVALS